MTSIPQLENRRLVFTSGLVPTANLRSQPRDVDGSEERSSILKGTKLEFLARCRLFTRQVDVVIPSPPTPGSQPEDAIGSSLLSELRGLKTCYGKARIGISDIVTAGERSEGADLEGRSSSLSALHSSSSSSVQVLSNSREEIDEDDCWCIDSRGILTLSVGKETYETLGLVGKRLPFKGCEERRVIQFPLHDLNRKGADANAERRKRALRDWDERRKQGGKGLWDVLVCSTAYSGHEAELQGLERLGMNAIEIKTVNCQVGSMQDVHIPFVNLKPPASVKKGSAKSDEEKEEEEEWYGEIAALYEWTGMAGLGAQRLKANDRVDSYVASYEPPEPSKVGDVQMLKWRGLLGPGFVDKILEKAIALLRNSNVPFTCITSSPFTTSPVSFIPPEAFATSKSNHNTAEDISSMKVPRRAGEETWSLILSDSPEGVQWVMMESIGKWNLR